MAEEPIEIDGQNEERDEVRTEETLSAGEPTSAAIKNSIEDTRERLGETIDAIGEKLSFQNISEQVSEQVNNALETAKETVYDATIGKIKTLVKETGDGISKSRMVKTMQRNPFPFVLIGLGAGLLVFQGFGRGDSSRLTRYRYPANKRGNGEDLTDAESQSGRSADSSHEDSMLGTMSNAAGSAYEGITDAASQAYSSASDLAQRAYDSAGQLKSKAMDSYDQYIDESPLALGAIALAAGAAVGLAIPATRYEGELMGEARQNVLEKASDLANDYLDQARDATQNLLESHSTQAD